jgi:hypothetical protein
MYKNQEDSSNSLFLAYSSLSAAYKDQKQVNEMVYRRELGTEVTLSTAKKGKEKKYKQENALKNASKFPTG